MDKKSLLYLLILPLIWGIYYVATNTAVAAMSVFSVGIVIRFITLILLTVMMGCRGQLKELFRVKKVWKKLIMIGVLGFLLDTTAFIGLTMCSAGIGTVLLKTDVIFVNLISVWIYKQKFRAKDWLLTFVMLFGIVLVLGIDFAHVDIGGIGNLFFIASALFVSINAFVIKSAQHDKNQPVSDNVVAYYNNFVTMVLFTIAAALTDTLGQLQFFLTDRNITVALLIASLGQTLIYVFYYYNLRHFPVWLVKIFLLLVPIVAALISFVLFDEELTLVQVIGMAIVLGCAGCFVVGHQENQTGRSELPANKEE